MKRNAIVRIVLWSILLVVLLAVFCMMLYVPGANIVAWKSTLERSTAATLVTSPTEEIILSHGVTPGQVIVYSAPNTSASQIAVLEKDTTVTTTRQELIGGEEWDYITEPCSGWIQGIQMVTHSVDAGLKNDTGTITATAVNFRSAPDVSAAVAGMLHSGDTVTIGRMESVNGILWGYMTSPEAGWIQMEYVELSDAGSHEVPLESTPVNEPQEALPSRQIFVAELDAATVREIEIEWASGDIRILPGDTEKIRIQEDARSNTTHKMVWEHKGSELSIRFSEKNVTVGFGINLESVESKDLTIYVPRNWNCNSLEIDAALATLTVNDLAVREVEIDTASGECYFNNCVLDTLDLDTASGDVQFSGELQVLECDAASADITAVLTNVPRQLDLDSLSGDLDITLPSNAGFTLKMDALSKDFSSDFETVQRNGSYVAGNGSCRINVDAMSGSVTIRKGQ